MSEILRTCKYSTTLIIKVLKKLYFHYHDCLDIHEKNGKEEYKYISRSFISFLEKNFQKETIEMLFNECLSCKCCEIHTKYRPTSLQPWDFNPNPEKSRFHLKSQKEVKPCLCCCRSYTRIMHHLFNPNNKFCV